MQHTRAAQKEIKHANKNTGTKTKGRWLKQTNRIASRSRISRRASLRANEAPPPSSELPPPDLCGKREKGLD